MNLIFAILFMAFSVGAAEESSILYSALPKDGCAEGRKRCEGICHRCIAEGRRPDGCYGGVVFNICCDGNGGRTDGSSCECRAK
ncbi:hypothetical protein M0R72_00705 [Candidatus Pacearchaeota archaeon]|jgi:hypothetical protein|nr:hypothetical protein [Candidatus Pacearchaeota archaeon]